MCLLLLSLVAGAGCVHVPFSDKDEKPAPAQRPPVTPEQVKENNARRMAEFLDQEVKADETTPAQKPEADEKKK
jgi:hypothetical protein